MKKTIYFLAIIVLVSCATVPFTGRKQFKLLRSSQMNAMAVQSYGEFLKTHKLSTNQQQTKMVKNVGNKMKIAVEKYLKDNGQLKIIEGFKWEFNLVDEDAVNAWAMPGGKVVFYSGIIPVCKNEEGIAVVMGHEIAHIIAKHGNERMTQGMIAQLGGMALDVALEQKPQETKNLFMAAYGIGAQVGVLLPYSRVHELEADKIGLIIMAIAGYNPGAAPVFWERMSAQSNHQSPPEFLSTHPSNERRIEEMKLFVPEAKKYAEKNK